MSAFLNHQLLGRRVKFDFTSTPKHWVPGDVLTTHVLNSMHILLPAVEYWFCRLANQTLPYVTDENLRADIKGFVAQEAMHANAHKAAEAYFATHGIDATAFKNRMDWIFKNLLNDTPLGLKWPFKFFQKEWLAYRMGVIAALEHYFCFFGTWVLQAEGLDQVGADPAMLDLTRWHGAEEVEHRTVAFDAYRGLVGDGVVSYLGRQAAMVVAFPAMLTLWLGATVYLSKIDGTEEGKRLGKKSLPRILFDFEMTARRSGRLPTLFIVVSGLKDWLKPGHHPEHDGDLDAAMRYLARSPAAVAAAETALAKISAA